MRETISRYRILKELDVTEPGNVYLAEEPSVGVVVVRLFPDTSAQRDSEAFFRATQAWLDVNHPNIAPVLDAGEHDGRLFVVRPFVDGKPLFEVVVRRTQIRRVDALALMQDLASALTYIHQHGMVHGNLHPSKLIVDVGGSIKVVDQRFQNQNRAVELDDADVLDPNAVRYAPPEGLTGGMIDSRSDIFCFGAILYEVLTGRPAFPGSDVAQIRREILSAPSDLIDIFSSTDANVLGIVERCLQKDPERRYQNMNEVVRELEGIRRQVDGVAAPVAHANEQLGDEPGVTQGAVRVLDENVQFTVYRRSVVAPDRWYPMLAFAHLAERRPDAPADEPDPLIEVERQADQVLGEDAAAFRPVVQDSGRAIPARGHLRFVPDVEGVEFNPPERSFLWTESVHREEFRLRASPELDGRVARGVVSVYLGHLLIAEITMVIRVDSQIEGKERIAEDARPYRRIFASYSHSDRAIVEELEEYVQSLGDEYLRDATRLRSGEVWSPRLKEMIAKADVFQLFWSWNSLRSRFVRAEWEYALALRRGHFIRPVYWEDPFPSTTDLPPPSLRVLHFKQIRSRGVTQTRNAGNTTDLELGAVEAPLGLDSQTKNQGVLLTLKIAALMRSGERGRQVFSDQGGSIGRATSNTWVLAHSTVSSRHAEITFHGGVFYITDLSRNGTSVNSRNNTIVRGRPFALQSGDRIFIEPYEIDVTIESGAKRPGHQPIEDRFGHEDPFAPMRGPHRKCLSPVPPPPAGDEVDPLKFFDEFSPRAPRNAAEPVAAPFKEESVIRADRSPLAPDSEIAPIPRIAEAPPPPSVVSPPVAPAPMPVGSGSGALDFAGILSAAGLHEAAVTPEVATNLGQILRVVVSGLMDVLHSHQLIREEFRMRHTNFRPTDNNPLKFSANVEDALHNLLVKRSPAYLDAVEAFADAFDDLRDHQLAMLAGMRVAFEAMLADLHPDRLQEEFDRQIAKGPLLSRPARLRYWDLYREKHLKMLKDPEAAFSRLFREEFARAYDEQLREFRAQRRNTLGRTGSRSP